MANIVERVRNAINVFLRDENKKETYTGGYFGTSYNPSRQRTAISGSERMVLISCCLTAMSFSI